MPDESTRTPSDRRRQFMTQTALQGSAELRSLLPLTETHYLRLTLEAQGEARAYLMYSVLDSIYEAGVAMMRWRISSTITDPPTEASTIASSGARSPPRARCGRGD